MGETTAETMKEIEQARDRLGADVHALQERLPSPVAVARKAAAAIAASLGGALALWFTVRTVRNHRAKSRRPELVERVAEIVPDRWVGAVENADARSVAAVTGSMLVLMKAMELRRLRAISKAVAARM